MINESAAPAPQRQLLANVLNRVQMWSQLPPYYRDKAVASRGTEAVLNAVILTNEAALQGHLNKPTLAALEAMWQTQQTAGASAGSWPWIQFNAEPWEAPDSAYYGATLAALAIASAPDDYRNWPSIQENLGRLRDYLMRAFADQTLLNRIDLLWTASRLPGFVQPAMRDSVLHDIWALQRADGGWSLPTLIPHWRRKDGSGQIEKSDGYATGLIALVLQESAIPLADARLQRALHWLQRHQSWWNGRWSTDSLNHKHGWRAESRHFMDDAATAFAVLALVQARPASGRAAAVSTAGDLRSE